VGWPLVHRAPAIGVYGLNYLADPDGGIRVASALASAQIIRIYSISAVRPHRWTLAPVSTGPSTRPRLFPCNSIPVLMPVSSGLEASRGTSEKRVAGTMPATVPNVKNIAYRVQPFASIPTAHPPKTARTGNTRQMRRPPRRPRLNSPTAMRFPPAPAITTHPARRLV